MASKKKVLAVVREIEELCKARGVGYPDVAIVMAAQVHGCEKLNILLRCEDCPDPD